ncbi:MAG: histidine triad nucleotide-binding protein [Fibrobacterales bacterium]
MADNCVFCKLSGDDMLTEKYYEDESIIAIKDIAPQAPIHFLVIPKVHKETIFDFEECDSELLGKLFLVAKKVAKELGLEENGFRMIVNTKSDGGQAVNHLHLHVLGGRKMVTAMG